MCPGVRAPSRSRKRGKCRAEEGRCLRPATEMGTTMTQSGGPAAINGFLYQIIQHLDWMTGLTLTGTLAGEELIDGLLILEPRTGGDARAEAAGRYCVEQYKTRPGGTWAVGDLESVLRDLRKAVPESCPEHARYRFVTDGRAGRIEAFNAFLADVRSAVSPDELENVSKQAFGGDRRSTNRAYFDYLVDQTRSGHSQSSDTDRARLFHLLARFELQFELDGDAKSTEVEKRLRPFVPNLGDERGIRERLVGMLMNQLSKGEVRYDGQGASTLFRDAGLNPGRVRKFRGLATKLAARMRQRLLRLKYQADRDVRPVPRWPDDKPVLLITGPSGTGKTWQLGRLLGTIAEQGQVATLALAGQSADDRLQNAANDIWIAGLDDTSDKSIASLARHLRELTDQPSSVPLTIAMDNIDDVDTARDLLRRDWDDWNMRLVMTVPAHVAQSIVLTDGAAVHVHTLGNFSVDELDTLLCRSGRRWSDLPHDLKKILRNPMLAGVFLELPYTSAQTAPHSEYELFERFWQRITAKGGYGDEGIVIALGGAVLEGKPHPLPRPAWMAIGLTGEILERLDSTGWLTKSEDGDAAFAHDRLLNWAVAKFLASRYRRAEVTLEDLTAFFTNKDQGIDRRVHARLAYMPMDTFWLLAEDDRNALALATLARLMERTHLYGSHGSDLYGELLPTLGDRAISILMERLNAIIRDTEGAYQTELIGKAFANLARQNNVALTRTLRSLLSSSDHERQSVAVAILTAAPDSLHLDRLWAIHQRRVESLEDKSSGSRHIEYQASFAALKAGVALDPNWLRIRILQADPEQEQVSELGYLLNGLDHLDAPAIWREAGNVLMAKVPVRRPRSLLYCIARFGDRAKMEFVTRHLTQPEDFANGAALHALSILDPQAAIERLVEVDEAERYLSRNEWLPALLRAEADLTRRRILDLAQVDPKGRHLVEMLFAERPDEMNEEMLLFVLRSLETELRCRLDATIAGDALWLHRPLSFLRPITHPRLLKILRAEAGSDLERMITDVACSRVRSGSIDHDHVREDARSVLILIGSDGITNLIDRELNSEHFWVRHRGLSCAYMRTDGGTADRLAAIANRPMPRDANGKPESHARMEFHDAMVALAANGPDKALAEALSRNGAEGVPTELTDLREHRGPMAKALTAPALETLRSTGADENAQLNALATAWVSGDKEFIPPVRSILQGADPNGIIARYACIALENLGDQSEEFAQLALLLAHTTENNLWGLQGLASIKGRGLELLEEWLLSRNSLTKTDREDAAVRILYQNPPSRAVSIKVAAERCLQGRTLLDPPYEVAAESNAPAVRDLILDKAFTTRLFVTTQSVRAIEGLAKFDLSRAIEAIEQGLQSHPSIERELCQLLVRIAPALAGEKLIDVALFLGRKSLLSAAGRALRRLDGIEVSRILIERTRRSAAARRAAAEIAGWIPSPALGDTLGQLADYDDASDVRHTALIALDRHGREAHVRALLVEFPAADAPRRWSLLYAILHSADPYLLADRTDPIWVGHVLSKNTPYIFAYHAKEVLQKRQREFASARSEL